MVVVSSDVFKVGGDGDQVEVRLNWPRLTISIVKGIYLESVHRVEYSESRELMLNHLEIFLFSE
jgi:hypothetical protein